MRRTSSVAAGREGFANGGPVRGVRVRLRDWGPAEADQQLLLALLAAGFAGVAAGVMSSDPSLFLGWLS
jgi:hypothetical protein